MIVDQHRPAVPLRIGVAGDMDFADQLAGNRIDKIQRVVAVVEGADMDVVDVQQQAAAAAPRRFDAEFTSPPRSSCRAAAA